MSPQHRLTLKEVAGQMLATGLPLHELEREVRWAIVEAALEKVNGNQCKVAKRLGLHRNTISRDLAEMFAAGRLPEMKKKKLHWYKKAAQAQSLPNFFVARAVRA